MLPAAHRPAAPAPAVLIAGLGNPGARFLRTRHNLGKIIVRAFARRLLPPSASFQRKPQLQSLVAEGALPQFPQAKVLLALPTTYMNNSGKAISKLLAVSKLPPQALVVVHDDKDLAWGQIKLQFNRGAAGHRGVLSIIEALHTKAFHRLRAGLGRPQNQDTNAFVLSKFTKEEWRELQEEIIPRAAALLFDRVQAMLANQGTTAA